jgi:stage V sporulation protein G
LNITEVRVKLMRNRSDRLRAFCSITIDGDFVVHDLRVIEGRKGLFVAMPSRKLTDNCPRCSAKNELRAKFCGDCGAPLSHDRAEKAAADKSHVDVAHPINTPCREMLQETVLAAYRDEAQRAGEAVSADDATLPAEFDDSPDEPVDQTESEWGEPEVEETEALPVDVRDNGSPAGNSPHESEPAVQPFDEIGAFDLTEADEPADEQGPVGVEAGQPVVSEDGGESPAQGEESKPRVRSRAERKTGGFGEGIF